MLIGSREAELSSLGPGRKTPELQHHSRLPSSPLPFRIASSVLFCLTHICHLYRFISRKLCQPLLTSVIMSDGGLLKPEKDFTKDADKLIPEAEALAKVRYPSA